MKPQRPKEDREYWATFSIYDYRTPRFRQALVLFDRIVVPVPDAPMEGSRGEITGQDLERLSAELTFLEKNDAAVPLTWNRKEFDAWRGEKSGEALAQLLDRDRELATRLHVQEAIEKTLSGKEMITGEGYNAKSAVEATVVPVYARFGDYQQTWRGTMADAQVVEIAAAELPMPADDEALERIIELRHRDSFKAFMPSFRKWQEKVALRLVQAGEDEEIRSREIRVATLELQIAVEQFKQAVKDVKFEKVVKGVTLPLVVGSALFGHVDSLLTATAEHGPELFQVRTLVQPWWRPILDKECALAGVICEAQTR